MKSLKKAGRKAQSDERWKTMALYLLMAAAFYIIFLLFRKITQRILHT